MALACLIAQDDNWALSMKVVSLGLLQFQLTLSHFVIDKYFVSSSFIYIHTDLGFPVLSSVLWSISHRFYFGAQIVPDVASRVYQHPDGEEVSAETG